MLTWEGSKGVQFCDGMTRRDFLRVGSLTAGAVGLSLTDLARLQSAGAASATREKRCILLFLVGGPSHLDTWDLKPDAPDNIRGPFQPTHTNVPGIAISEHFPLMAQRAHQYALVRSVFHRAAPIHETGHQLMQTGQLFRPGEEYPHIGSVVSQVHGDTATGLPPFVMVPRPIGNTGVSIGHGQTAGILGEEHNPFCLNGDPARMGQPTEMVDAIDRVERSLDNSDSSYLQNDSIASLFHPRAKQAFDLGAESSQRRGRYGLNTFGQSCLLARRLVENGVRLVTVNMFDTVFNEVTWDCHADGGSLATTLDDYKRTLCPMFDKAYTALVDDLTQRGLLDDTLVVAMGEFGRTPQMNLRGGRDHWPSCWTVLFAGGGVRGGQVIGASDAHGAEPADRPVHASEVAATIYHALGIDVARELPGLVGGEPVRELFGA
jgi:hypothetical protein